MTILNEYKLNFILVSRILNGIHSNNFKLISDQDIYDVNNKLKQTYIDKLRTHINKIEVIIFNWIKEQLLLDKIPPNTLDFNYIWYLIIHDKELNPKELSQDIWYEQFINSNKRNKMSSKIKLKNKGKYHVNQGGKYGKK